MKSNDGKQQISAILSQWLPLAPTLLKMIVDELPAANALTAERAERLMCSKSRRFDTLPAQTQKLKDAFLKCGKLKKQVISDFRLIFLCLSQGREKRIR